MDVMHDGVEIYILPDCARCKSANENPLYIFECPKGKDICFPAYCEEYTEEEQKTEDDET